MPIVHFKDRSGREWEVMEVRPSSTVRLAVTEHHESGWLAFKHGDERRRLAPIPDKWQELDARALDALCRAARRVEQVRALPFAERRRVPREDAPPEQQDHAASVRVIAARAAPPLELAADVKTLTREAAKAARTNDETVVSGLLNLRKILAAKDIAPDSDAFRAARQLFLEVYYFRG